MLQTRHSSKSLGDNRGDMCLRDSSNLEGLPGPASQKSDSFSRISTYTGAIFWIPFWRFWHAKMKKWSKLILQHCANTGKMLESTCDCNSIKGQWRSNVGSNVWISLFAWSVVFFEAKHHLLRASRITATSASTAKHPQCCFCRNNPHDIFSGVAVKRMPVLTDNDRCHWHPVVIIDSYWDVEGSAVQKYQCYAKLLKPTCSSSHLSDWWVLRLGLWHHNIFCSRCLNHAVQRCMAISPYKNSNSIWNQVRHQ